MVRLYLASALQRLPLEQRWEILDGLVGHAEDCRDQNLPLMYWYAAEPLAAVDARRAARLASSSPIPLIQEFMARRIGAIGTPESLAILVEELGRADRLARRDDPPGRDRGGAAGPSAGGDARGLARGLREPRGRRRPAGPLAGDGAGADLRRPPARAALRGVLADAKADLASRREALAALLKAKDAIAADQLHGLILDPALGGPAVRGLSAYDDPATPGDPARGRMPSSARPSGATP